MAEPEPEAGRESEREPVEEQEQPEKVLIAEVPKQPSLPEPTTEGSRTSAQLLKVVLSIDQASEASGSTPKPQIEAQSPSPSFQALGTLPTKKKSEFSRGFVRSVETIVQVQETAPQELVQQTAPPVEYFLEDEPEVYLDPFEVSLHYVEKHNILQIFQLASKSKINGKRAEDRK